MHMEGQLMIKLRRATLNDYKVYSDLWTNIDYHWMYNIAEDEPSGQTVQICQEDLNYITSYYNHLSLDQFKEDMTNFKVYIILKDDSIIGFVSLMSCGHDRYKIVDFPLYDFNKDDISEVVQELRQLYKKSGLFMTVLDTSIIGFILSLGFKESKTNNFYAL